MRLLYIAKRYAFSSSNRHRAKSVRIALGMMISTLALIVTISVMDFLQNSRFTSLREVKSFDLVVQSEEIEEVKAIVGETPCFIYKEMPALLVTDTQSKAVMVRYIDESYQGGLYSSSLNLVNDGALISPYYMNSFSDNVKLVYLDQGKVATRTLKTQNLEIEGYYRTKLGSDFDSLYIFLPLTMAPSLLKTQIAVLGEDTNLHSKLIKAGYKTTTWQEAESSLYQAMMVEKWMMIIILSMLFIIILVQINTNSRLFIEAKKGEIATLWSLGLTLRDCALSFALSGAFVTALGCLLGILLSYLVLHFVPTLLSLPLFTSLAPDLKLASAFSVGAILLSAAFYYCKTKRILKTSLEILYE